MAEIELIPADYMVMRRWRRHLTRLAIALLLVALVTAGVRSWLGWRIASERPAVAALRQAQTTAQARRTALEALRKDKQDADDRLLALQALRDHTAWPLVFRAIDAAHHPNLWFDELEYLREARAALPAGTTAPAVAAVAAPAASAASAAAGGTAPPLLHRFEITGHALTHAAVTDFMRELGSQPGIANLRLTDSGMRRYSTVDVVDFRLSGVVDTERSASR